MADSGFRLLLMLQKIPREPRSITTRQLHQQLLDDGYDITVRTVQRDMDTLSTAFPIFQTAPTGKGKTGMGWSFRKDSRHTGIPLMDPSAALTLLMGMEHLQRILPPPILTHLQPFRLEAQETLQKLDKRHYASWIDKVRVVPQHILQAPSITPDTLQTVYTALLDNCCFSATYNGRDNQVLHPYGLVQRGGSLYLLCRFFAFDDIRITALHRFSNVILLDTPVRPFPDFDIDHYLSDGAMQWPIKDNKPITLQLRIDRWLTGHLSESPLSDDQKITIDQQKDGWNKLKAHVVDSHELRWWLLSQGNSVEVLAPLSLRRWFGEIAISLSRSYSE